MIKSLTQFAQEVSDNKNNPGVLADLHVDIAVKYAFLSDVAKDIQLEKATFWNIKFFDGDDERVKPLSDTFIEAKWRQTEGGKKELKMKYELRALERLMAAIKSSIVISSIEAKNMA